MKARSAPRGAIEGERHYAPQILRVLPDFGSQLECLCVQWARLEPLPEPCFHLGTAIVPMKARDPHARFGEPFRWDEIGLRHACCTHLLCRSMAKIVTALAICFSTALLLTPSLPAI